MRSTWFLTAFACMALALSSMPSAAQRHSFGSSPPTAPPLHNMGASGPVAPISSGMGPIQYVAVNYGVPAPQALTRQLRSEDDRTRAAALSAIGAPGQYLQRGHIVMPHTIQLELVPLGNNDDLHALLTAELDQHIVTAILVEEDGNWRRVATVFYATNFDDPHTTPASFVHTARSLLQRDRYRAVFHASSAGPDGNFVENEAELRVLNGRAVITMSFADQARECGASAGLPGSANGCTVTRRWLQADPADPTKRFLLVTATGRISPRDEVGALGDSRDFQTGHLRNFSCQPFVYSDTSLRFEPVAPSGSCPVR